MRTFHIKRFLKAFLLMLTLICIAPLPGGRGMAAPQRISTKNAKLLTTKRFQNYTGGDALKFTFRSKCRLSVMQPAGSKLRMIELQLYDSQGKLIPDAGVYADWRFGHLYLEPGTYYLKAVWMSGEGIKGGSTVKVNDIAYRLKAKVEKVPAVRYQKTLSEKHAFLGAYEVEEGIMPTEKSVSNTLRVTLKEPQILAVGIYSEQELPIRSPGLSASIRIYDAKNSRIRTKHNRDWGYIRTCVRLPAGTYTIKTKVTRTKAAGSSQVGDHIYIVTGKCADVEDILDQS